MSRKGFPRVAARFSALIDGRRVSYYALRTIAGVISRRLGRRGDDGTGSRVGTDLPNGYLTYGSTRGRGNRGGQRFKRGKFRGHAGGYTLGATLVATEGFRCS